MSDSRRDFLRYGILLAGGTFALSAFPAKDVGALYSVAGRLAVSGIRWLLGNSARAAVRNGLRQAPRAGRQSWITLGRIEKVALTGLSVGSVVSVTPKVAEALQELNIDVLLVKGDNNDIILEANTTVYEQRPLHLYVQKTDLVSGNVSQAGPLHIGLRPGGKLEVPLASWFPGFEVFDLGARQISARTHEDAVQITPSPKYMVVNRSDVQVSEG